MIITQDDLIQTIAQKEDIDVSTVRTIFDATENTIFGHLSSITPTQSVVIKLLNGLKITGAYVPEKEVTKGIFQKSLWKPHIKIKAHMTKHYNYRINQQCGYTS